MFIYLKRRKFKSMIQVVECKDELYTTRRLDLERSTLDRAYGLTMTFCYYQETDCRTVFAGMKPKTENVNLKIFIKLVDNEPVDLSVEEWMVQWSSFPELIPEKKNFFGDKNK